MIRSWSDIRGYYADLEARDPRLGAMRDLIEEIEASPDMNRLFAWTSMHDLIIVQTPVTYPYDGPRLRISPKFDGTVEFRYVDTPIVSKQWHCTVRCPEAFAQLRRFADQLRWFASGR